MESGSPPATASKEAATDRLFTLQRQGETDAAFARRIGLPPQVLSNYKNGYNQLSLQSALIVQRNTSVCLCWLLAGTGEPFGHGETDERERRSWTRQEVRSALEAEIGANLELIRSLSRAGLLAEAEVGELQGALRSFLSASRGEA